jgi:hypothetical protein
MRDSDVNLTSLARQILKRENVGVLRKGPQFVVSDEAITAFVTSYHDRLGMTDYIRSIRRGAPKQEISW